MIRLLLLVMLLSGCDMLMKTGTKKIPDSFDVESFIYTHGRFPDCYSSVSKITKESAFAFEKNKNDFRESQHLNSKYDEWRPTPVPSVLMDEDELKSIVSAETIDSGVHCFRKYPDFAKEYRKIYTDSLTKKGAYYTFSESKHTFMLYIPSERLLIHTIR